MLIKDAMRLTPSCQAPLSRQSRKFLYLIFRAGIVIPQDHKSTNGSISYADSDLSLLLLAVQSFVRSSSVGMAGG